MIISDIELYVGLISCSLSGLICGFVLNYYYNEYKRLKSMEKLIKSDKCDEFCKIVNKFENLISDDYDKN